MPSLPRLASLLLLLALLAPAYGQDKSQPREGSTAALMKLLDMPLDTRALQEPIKLKTALEYLYEKSGDKLVILVDRAAFRTILGADEDDVYDQEVSLPSVPTKLTGHVALRLLTKQIARGKATYIFRQGHIAIIPEEHNRSEYFLRQPILVVHQKKPLEEVLEQFSEATGLTINIDERAQGKAKTPITATFRNTPLEDALVVATESADLKFVVLTSSVLVTTPEHAAAIAKEQKERQLREEKPAP